MERKRFTHGTGRLDAQQLNLMAEAAWQAENTPDPMNMPALRGPFMGIINPPSGTAPQVLENDNNGNPVQWGYAVAFVSPEWATAPDGGVLKDANSGAYRSTGFSVEDAVALNMVEMNNSSLNIMNVQTCLQASRCSQYPLARTHSCGSLRWSSTPRTQRHPACRASLHISRTPISSMEIADGNQHIQILTQRCRQRAGGVQHWQC